MNAKVMKIYFQWMGAYWSCSPATWDRLQTAANNYQGLELTSPDIRELKSRPKGRIEQLVENK